MMAEGIEQALTLSAGQEWGPILVRSKAFVPKSFQVVGEIGQSLHDPKFSRPTK